MTKPLIASALFAVLAFNASAQGTGFQEDGRKINTITTAVPFLRISPDARSGGMGDLGIAISPDANAQFWNVGKIPFNSKLYGVGVTYTPWLKDLVPDIFLAYLSGYVRFGRDTAQAISASLRYFSLGDITYTDNGIDPTGTGKPREFSFDLGYSRRLSQNLGVGISMRYIHSAIASGLSGGPGSDYKPGNTFGADVGLFYTKTKEVDEFRYTNLSIGAVISNLGGKISYNSLRKDYLPANLGLGFAYTSQFDEFNKITFGIDLNKLLVPSPTDTNTQPNHAPSYDPHVEKSVVAAMLGSFGDAKGGFSEELAEIDFSVGAEYWYQNQFAVRAGYFYEDATKGDRKYFTVGVGAKYSVLTINASYLVPSGSGTTRNPLSNTLRFSLVADFDAITKAKDKNTKE